MQKGIFRKQLLGILVSLSAVLFLFATNSVLAQDEASSSAAADTSSAAADQPNTPAAVSAPVAEPARNASEQEKALAAQEKQKIQNATEFRQDVQDVVAVRKEELPFNMESYARFMPKSGVSAQDGSVGVIDSSVQWSYEYKMFDRLPLEFSMEQDYIGINNSTVVKVPSRLTGISFGLDATLPLVMTKNLYFRIGVSPSFYTDSWSMYENALRLNQRYFAIWQPNDKFTAILGMAVQPRYRNVFLPIAGIIYKPNDKWLFNLVPTRPTISYAVSDKLTFYGEYSLSGGEYVVTKDDIKGTVLQYDEQHAGLGVKYNLNKHVQGSWAVGGVFGRRLQYRESYGKINIKNGFYSEFRLNIEM